MNWYDDAACKDVPLAVFFPVAPPDSRRAGGERAYQQARAICGPCPVRDRCLAEALKAETAAGGRHGMWGGLSPDARAQLVKKR